MSGRKNHPNYAWPIAAIAIVGIAFSRGGTQVSHPPAPQANTLSAATAYVDPAPAPSPIPSAETAETPPAVRESASPLQGGEASRLTPSQNIPDAQPNAPAAVGDTQVWVNTNSGVYHFPGQRWYGRTKHGMFMSQKDADANGYRPTRNGQ